MGYTTGELVCGTWFSIACSEELVYIHTSLALTMVVVILCTYMCENLFI